MEIRLYELADAEEVVRLFHTTVRTVNLRDYTPEQVAAWAPDEPDVAAWDATLRAHRTYVAVMAGTIVGFADMDDTGYLDHLYVHRDFQRQGIATALCRRLEAETSAASVRVAASVTARPFFERRGYRVVRRQEVERRGQRLANYVMEKPLRPTTA